MVQRKASPTATAAAQAPSASSSAAAASASGSAAGQGDPAPAEAVVAKECERIVSRPGVPAYFVQGKKTGLAQEGQVAVCLDGAFHKVTGQKGSRCLKVESTKDWDGNGTMDALIVHQTACGGNGAGDDFFFVHNDGNGAFRATEPFNVSVYEDPRIEKYKGQWSVVVREPEDNASLADKRAKSLRFLLVKGKTSRIEETGEASIPAVFEVKSSALSDTPGADAKTYKYDLNDDGKADEIRCQYWARQDSMVWSIKMSDGRDIKSDIGCKRVGVLEKKTLGFHDIVCDRATVLAWNGTAYALTKAPVRSVTPTPREATHP